MSLPLGIQTIVCLVGGKYHPSKSVDYSLECVPSTSRNHLGVPNKCEKRAEMWQGEVVLKLAASTDVVG